MYLSKEIPFRNQKREAFRYQPSFDLRKNIAKVVADYSILAVQKNILLDIFVDHETPNYFKGDLNCFLGLVSELLRHCIESLNEGEICIRINHESIHKNNNCKAELSLVVTTRGKTGRNNLPEINSYSQLNNAVDKSLATKRYASFLRIQHLCSYFGGKFTTLKLKDQKTKYSVTFVLQQVHPHRMLHLA